MQRGDDPNHEYDRVDIFFEISARLMIFGGSIAPLDRGYLAIGVHG